MHRLLGIHGYAKIFLLLILSEGNEKLCTERLRFESLSVRRHRTDLIETYKYINNKYKTPPQSLFSVPNRDLRGHNERFSSHMQSLIDIQKYFFSHRVVEPWNLLSSDVIDSFQRRLMRVDDLSTIVTK